MSELSFSDQLFNRIELMFTNSESEFAAKHPFFVNNEATSIRLKIGTQWTRWLNLTSPNLCCIGSLNYSTITVKGKDMNKKKLASAASDLRFIGKVNAGTVCVSAGYAPRYQRGVPELERDAKPGALYGRRVDGWCMWPGMWDGDILVIRRVEPFAGDVVDRWEALHDKIVHVEARGKALVKRLVVQSRDSVVMLCCDNQTLFATTCFSFDEVVVRGIVELVVPVNRDPAKILDEMRDEFARIYRPDLTRKVNPDRDGVEQV